MTHRFARPALLTLLLCARRLGAADYTTPIYGVVAPADMDPTAAAWFATAQPVVFRQLVVGQVTSTTTQTSSPFVRSIYHAHLLPVVVPTPQGYAIAGYQTDRLDSVSASSGSLQTTILLTPSPALPVVVPASVRLLVYTIRGATVDHASLGNGTLFPTPGDAATFRFTEAGLTMRGSTDGTWLIGGGANLVPLAQTTATPLASYPGAYVQLQDTASGVDRYVLQSRIQPADSATYDPVLDDGGLILGGASTLTSAATGTATATYTLAGVRCTGTWHLTDGLLAQQLPPALQPLALASETPPTPPASAPVINTSQQRGEIPVVDSQGQPTGAAVQLYGTPGTPQTTTQMLTDIHAQRDNATSGAPVDTMASAGGGDRITTPVTGAGASGLNQLQAQAQVATWNLATVGTSSGSDLITTIPNGERADGTPVGDTISAATFLQTQDESLNDQVTTTYSTTGAALVPQATPIVIDATGTIVQAEAAGAPDDTYFAAGVTNALMAPQMEDTTWSAAIPAVYHHAIIYPIDYLDPVLVRRYGAATGVTTPDQQGNPIPGDGSNPYAPVPQGCAAGHPFYDLNGDGSLDRWYSDDPFHGGYQKLKILWVEEPGGAREIGDFASSPSYNVVITGLKAPTEASPGLWTTQEDLLFTVGHNFKPFDHASFHRFGFKTYYDGGLITPLDPISATDPTQYQLSIRNLTTFAPASTPPSDGATPQQLVPTVVAGLQTEQLDLLGTGTPQTYTLSYTVDFYDALAPYIQCPPWSWAWSLPGFTLPSAVTDHPGSPAVFHGTLTDATGTTVQTQQAARPLYTDPTTSEIAPFTPSLIPVQSNPPPPSQPITTTYMWNYPVGRSTAEGGTQQADPLHWVFPWNLPWNDDAHSRNMSAQAFTLNSANLAYFPEYAAQAPLITHAGLVAANDGTSPIVLQWLLQETPATNPSGAVPPWRDGQVLYPQAGWAPPAPWWTAGRSPFHVAGWDPRTDAWVASRAIGGCTMPSGARVYDVLAGYATYVFRGTQYVCTTAAQQRALLVRMWNYYLTGYEQPPAGATTLPSLCIPQRLDNASLASPPLNTVSVPGTGAAAVTSRTGDANHAGDVGGALVADLASPDQPRYRAQTQRRIRLMGQQIYLFSAARGREWELQMARRMPQSVRLVCVEYDDKAAVKRVLGLNGQNVWFPTVTTSTYTDSMGATHAVQTSNETDVLREIASQWLDGMAPTVCYEQGEMAVNGDYTLHATTSANDPSIRTGSGSTIDPTPFAQYTGFAAHLPEGIPEGFAQYAFPLRSLPQYPQQQWTPDAGQPILADVAIEFRHPMLLLYHDGASAIYIHYGRNADPDAVFGQWNACAPPPPNLTVTSPEHLRRQRFDAYATPATLAHIFALLNPDGAAAFLAAGSITLPTPPPNPGNPPPVPVVVANPGPEPQPPTPPWAGLSGYDGLSLAEQEAQYIGPQPGEIPVLDWSAGAWNGRTHGFDPLAPVGPLGSTGTTLLAIDNGTPGVGGWADATAVFEATFTWEGPDATLTGSDYFDDTGTIAINGVQLDARSWTNGSGTIAWTFQDGQSYTIDLFHAGEGHPNAIALRFANPDAAAWPLRQQQVAAYQTALANYQNAEALWQLEEHAYLQYLAHADAYPPLAAAWSAAEDAWNGWQAAQQAFTQQQQAAQQFASAEQTWISLVLAQTAQANGSYSGDPACTLTTLAEFQAIEPQLPIWQAYAWFVDPANGVTQALPSAPTPAPAP